MAAGPVSNFISPEEFGCESKLISWDTLTIPEVDLRLFSDTSSALGIILQPLRWYIYHKLSSFFIKLFISKLPDHEERVT
jgi:hypothetical protein